MDTLRKGDQGLQVTQLQQRLAQRGYTALLSGVFGTNTWQTVRAFQTQKLDQPCKPSQPEYKAADCPPNVIDAARKSFGINILTGGNLPPQGGK